MKSLIYHLKAVDEAYANYVKYVGMVRLVKAIFTNYGGIKSWEESLFEALDTLDERESRVLKLRFGLLDNNFRTLDQVAKEFGVTRERIRQIEAKALRKLKHPSRKYVLMGASWQMAVQEAKQMGEKLLLKRSEEMKQQRKPISYDEVESIGLPTRVANALIKSGYKQVYDVMKATDKELLKARNMGEKSVRMVRYEIEKLTNP